MISSCPFARRTRNAPTFVQVDYGLDRWRADRFMPCGGSSRRYGTPHPAVALHASHIVERPALPIGFPQPLRVARVRPDMAGYILERGPRAELRRVRREN